MIARVFPPFRSVGHSIRAVKFIRYLPALGWLPSVLTIDDRKEYESDRKQGSETLLAEIPPEVSIYRTAAGEPSWKYLEQERAFGQRNWLTKSVGKDSRWSTSLDIPKSLTPGPPPCLAAVRSQTRAPDCEARGNRRHLCHMPASLCYPDWRILETTNGQATRSGFPR